MDRFSLEDLADDFSSEFLAAHSEIPKHKHEDIQYLVLAAARRAAQNERQACLAACEERQAMWEATEARSTIAEPLRTEARARSNEAAAIADAIRSAGPITPT
jgi:hypothetical protein